jgi:hypothetical protein
MKSLFSLRRFVVGMMGLVSLSLLLWSCTKFGDDNNNNTPAAGLMSFNLAPDQPGVYITLSGNNLSNVPLAYTSYSGVYNAIFPGERPVQSFSYPSDSALAQVNHVFTPDKYYSVFVIGANGNYQNLVTDDNFDSLAAETGKAFVRYVNAIADSSKPLVTIAANGTNVVSNNASFAAVSDFAKINAGDVTVNVNNGSSIDASRNITLEQNKVYTVLLVGTPGATDSTKAVQIKFISNGTVTNQ